MVVQNSSDFANVFYGQHLDSPDNEVMGSGEVVVVIAVRRVNHPDDYFKLTHSIEHQSHGIIKYTDA